MSSNKFEALHVSDDSDSDEGESGKGGPSGSRKGKGKAGGAGSVVVPPEEHRLQSTYCLWYSRKVTGKQASQQMSSFDQNLKLIATFASAEQFWKIYSHLVRPGDLSSHSDLHVFKEGIKPMWEDEANRYGGKWIVRLRKGLSPRCWENLLMAMLGEQFMVGEEICGVVVSVRFNEDILSIWNRTASDTAITNRIRDTFRRVLNLPQGTVIEYKAHNDSIRDHSSFRNTDVFVR